MPFCQCPLGCSRFLSSVDSHGCCLYCLGIQLAKTEFMDGLFVHCECVTIAALRERLSLLTGMGGAPSVTTHTGFSATSREPSASAIVRASLPGQSPWIFCSSSSVHLPGNSAVPYDGMHSLIRCTDRGSDVDV